jgi:hypothetical protein
MERVVGVGVVLKSEHKLNIAGIGAETEITAEI